MENCNREYWDVSLHPRGKALGSEMCFLMSIYHRGQVGYQNQNSQCMQRVSKKKKKQFNKLEVLTDFIRLHLAWLKLNLYFLTNSVRKHQIISNDQTIYNRGENCCLHLYKYTSNSCWSAGLYLIQCVCGCTEVCKCKHHY